MIHAPGSKKIKNLKKVIKKVSFYICFQTCMFRSPQNKQILTFSCIFSYFELPATFGGGLKSIEKEFGQTCHCEHAVFLAGNSNYVVVGCSFLLKRSPFRATNECCSYFIGILQNALFDFHVFRF